MINRKFSKSSLIIVLAVLISITAIAPAFAISFWVRIDQLNLRTAPSLDASVIDVLYKGDELSVLRTQGDFSEIRVKNTANKNIKAGTVGWVSNKYITADADSF